MNRTIFLDLETGGLAPHHPDIQVAAIAVEHWKELEVYEAKIRFDPAKAEAEALAMNSYDLETWKRESKSEAQVVEELGALFRRHVDIDLISKRGKAYSVARLAGHNAIGFDAPRLKAMFTRHEAFLPAEVYRPLDTLQLALWRLTANGERPASFSLEDLCKHCGVAFNDGHDALSDVRATIALARALIEPR